jgi:hypothetical protein
MVVVGPLGGRYGRVAGTDEDDHAANRPSGLEEIIRNNCPKHSSLGLNRRLHLAVFVVPSSLWISWRAHSLHEVKRSCYGLLCSLPTSGCIL